MTKKILVVDDDISFAAMVAEGLCDCHDITVAHNGLQAIDLCWSTPFDLVLSDIRMPGIEGPDLIREIRKIIPSVKTMLLTAFNIDDYIAMAKHHGISSIMPKSVPFDFSMLRVMVDGLLTHSIFGLSRYLDPDGAIDQKLCVRSSVEGCALREQICKHFVKRFGSSGDLNLVIDEIITNAIYHGPKLSDGSEKYSNFTPVHLQPDEYIAIELGYDSVKYGVSISDRQGKLKQETVLDCIERHISGKGIMDESGRGIHLSRLFTDVMVINIAPNSATEVILLNYISKVPKGSKPLYVNVVQGVVT